MSFAGNDDKISFFVNGVNQSVFPVDAAAETFAVAQFFRIANAFQQAVAFDALQQVVDAPDVPAINFLLVEIMLPSVVRPDLIHHQPRSDHAAGMCQPSSAQSRDQAW